MDKAARAAQLTRIVAHTGDEWAAGLVVFMATAAELRPDDPRLAGQTDRLIELTAATASLPAGLKAGTEIIRAGRAHRISRLDTNLHGITTLLVTR
jgi:hypothetical protein